MASERVHILAHTHAHAHAHTSTREGAALAAFEPLPDAAFPDVDGAISKRPEAGVAQPDAESSAQAAADAGVWPFLAGTHTHTRWLFLGGVYAVVMGIGACSTTQAAVNSGLGVSLGAGIYGALLCYLLGCAALLCVCALHARATRTRFFFVHAHELPRWYEMCGGVCGALYMITAVYLTPIVGVELFFSLVVAGQLSASLFLDHVGFAGLPVSRASKAKLLALGVAVAGVVVSAVGGLNADADGAMEANADDDSNAAASVPAAPPRPGTGVLIVYCGIIAVAGALQPMQSVLNWRLGRLLPNKLQAVSFSFFVAALVALTAAAAVFLSGIPTLSDIGARMAATAWWKWMGALAQIAVLAGGVVFPPRITTSLYYMLLLLGELAASLVYDDVGAFDLQRRPATPPRVIGLCLVMAGSMLMHYAKKLSDAVALYSEYLSRLRGGAVLRLLHTSGSTRLVAAASSADTSAAPRPLSWVSTFRVGRWSFARDSNASEAAPLFLSSACSDTSRTYVSDTFDAVDRMSVTTRSLSVASGP